MAQSLRGQFLIANRRLRDPNFFQSVVLIVEHNASGSMGLVVNRPTDITVSEALAEHFTMPESDERIFCGGPVEPASLFVLHGFEDGDPDEPCVLPGVFVGGSEKVFEDVVRRVAEGETEPRFRIYSGCSGWAPRQLEGELARGDWLIGRGSSDFVFHREPYDVWDLVKDDYCRTHPLAGKMPANPELN